MTSFGRLARRVTTKHGTKEYHPEDFPGESFAFARAGTLLSPGTKWDFTRPLCQARHGLPGVKRYICSAYSRRSGGIERVFRRRLRRLALSTYSKYQIVIRLKEARTPPLRCQNKKMLLGHKKVVKDVRRMGHRRSFYSSQLVSFIKDLLRLYLAYKFLIYTFQIGIHTIFLDVDDHSKMNKNVFLVFFL